MGFDLRTLRDAVARHGRVARIVVAATRGSAPREAGSAMLVWQGGQSGTIGGGALELAATRAALAGGDTLVRHPLGPGLGQCCGGAVTVLTEIYDDARAGALEGPVIARPVPGTTGPPPESVAQAPGTAPALIDGWMIEPVAEPRRPVWIWGAGHVGRALAGVLAPLPDLAPVWVDIAPERFPAAVPDGVSAVPARDMPRLVPHAPATAEHVIMSHSHEIDLALCHALLSHGFARAGLIGSATKWARFRKRLMALGHTPGEIARIDCPIGDPSLGKHPQAIAVGVAARMLAPGCATRRAGAA